MKRKEPKVIRVGTEDIAILPGGDVEARNCSHEVIGKVTGKVLDRIVAAAQMMYDAPVSIEVDGENRDLVFDNDDGDQPDVAIELYEVRFDTKQLKHLLKQRGPNVTVGVPISRKEAVRILARLEAARSAPHQLALEDGNTYDIVYQSDGCVEFGGERTYELDDLKHIQKMSQLMRNGNQNGHHKVRSPKEGHASP